MSRSHSLERTAHLLRSRPQRGVIGIAPQGWRGLVAGVIEQTAEAMRNLGATELLAAVGPMIHPECYAFRIVRPR